jgi:23S rRNA pseudouridine2605 synthase
MRVRFGIVNLPPRLKRGMLAELGPGEVTAILDWVGMEAQPVAAQHADVRSRPGQADGRGKTDKSGDKKVRVTDKGRQKNVSAATPRSKAGARRGVSRSKPKTGY